MKKLFLLLLFVPQIGHTQPVLLDETINEIKFGQDTIKSVYDWITDNIAYDVNKMHKIQKGTYSNKNHDFRNEDDYQAFLLEEVIKQRKGVCEDYSLLFDAIVSQLGYQSCIIEGYTKDSNGRLNRSIGHTWNAVKHGEWKIYDPTWGAGYIEDDRKFVKSYNEDWYNVSPEEMIKTHMPFDPVYQFTSNPITYVQFEKSTSTSKSAEHLNYKELLEIHFQKSEKEQMNDQLNRSLALGDGLWLVTRWRNRISRNVGLYGIISQQDLLEETFEKGNNAIELFNLYVKSKNKGFRGKKWGFDEAKQNLETAKEQAEAVLEVLNSIEVEDKSATFSINQSVNNTERLLMRIEQEMKYLQKPH